MGVKEKLPRKLALLDGTTVDVVRVHYYVGKGAYRVEYARAVDGAPRGCLAVAMASIFEETTYPELRMMNIRQEDRERDRADDHHQR